MSTIYTTIPLIKYDNFINKTSLELRNQEPDKWPMFRYKLIYLNERCIHVRERDGYCEFERYSDVDSFPFLEKIIEEFNVRVIDYCGLEYPDCE